MSLLDAMDNIPCSQCDEGHYTCRVTAGTIDSPGYHFSTYACPLCVHRRTDVVRKVYPDALVHGLPGRAHQPDMFEALETYEQEAML